MALAEPWTEVAALHTDQSRCTKDVAAIKQACAKDHDKAHALECAECWPKLVNRLRDLFLKPSSPEWFAGRRDFVAELDALLVKAQSSHQSQPPNLKQIDQRIRKEKEDWFREKATSLGLPSAMESSTEARDLQSKLADRELPIEQLVLELRAAFPSGRPDASNERTFWQFLSKTDVAPPSEKAEVYIQAVLQPEVDAGNAAKAEKYIKLIRGGTPPGQVLETLLRDRQSSRSEQDERNRLRKQLEELRRAKAAYQLAQTKRDKVRQDKARAAAAVADATAAAQQAQDLPPCATCAKTVDPEGFESCAVCQILSSHEVKGSRLVAWCSEQCRDRGFVGCQCSRWVIPMHKLTGEAGRTCIELA